MKSKRLDSITEDLNTLDTFDYLFTEWPGKKKQAKLKFKPTGDKKYDASRKGVFDFLEKQKPFIAEALPAKHRWIETDDLAPYADEILALIKASYAKVGGHHDFNSLSDVTKSGLTAFVIDVDEDPEVDAVIINKKTPLGDKGMASGTDGGKPAKDALVAKKISLLSDKGHYSEISGPLAKVLLKYDIPVIQDPEAIATILGKEIEFVGKNPEFPGSYGWYKRNVAGNPTMKLLVGRPR